MWVLPGRAASKAWLVFIDAFWIYVWLPGGETLRAEDVISLSAFTLGIVFELCGIWAAQLVNVWFYWAYAIFTVVLYALNRTEAHYGFGVALIGIPYLAIGAVNFYLYRRRRRSTGMDEMESVPE